MFIWNHCGIYLQGPQIRRLLQTLRRENQSLEKWRPSESRPALKTLLPLLLPPGVLKSHCSLEENYLLCFPEIDYYILLGEDSKGHFLWESHYLKGLSGSSLWTDSLSVLGSHHKEVWEQVIRNTCQKLAGCNSAFFMWKPNQSALVLCPGLWGVTCTQIQPLLSCRHMPTLVQELIVFT